MVGYQDVGSYRAAYLLITVVPSGYSDFVHLTQFRIEFVPQYHLTGLPVL